MEPNEAEYPHLFLNSWPFAIVPDDSSCKIWADREKLRKEIDESLDHAIKTKRSQISIFWAWYGAGKTHSLMHYKWKLNTNNDAYAVFTEFPQSAKKFLDLYRSLAEGLDYERLSKILKQVYEKLSSGIESENRKIFAQQIAANYNDFASVAEKISFGNNEEKELAERWLRTESLNKKERDELHVFNTLSADEDAVRTLSCLVRAITYKSNELQSPKLFVWMIDEFNRIDDISRTDYRSAIRAGLHNLFNRAQKSLCLMLTCSTRSVDDVYTILGDALKDRLSVSSRPLRIEQLMLNEARQFMQKLLEQYRTKKSPPNPFFPFTVETVDFILQYMLANNVPLTPRKVMDFHDFALHEGEDLIREGRVEVITPELASKALYKIPKEYYKI